MSATRWLRTVAMVLARRGRRHFRWWQFAGTPDAVPYGPPEAAPLAWRRVGPASRAREAVGAWMGMVLALATVWFAGPRVWRWWLGVLPVEARQPSARFGHQAALLVDVPIHALGGPVVGLPVLALVPALLIFAVTLVERRPVPSDPDGPPATARRSHRRAALQHVGGYLGGYAALVMAWQLAGAGDGRNWVVAEPIEPRPWQIVVSVLLCAALLGYVVRAVAHQPWLRFQVVRAAYATVGRLPWRTHRFLDDAVAAGVLVVDAGGYRFRDPRVAEALWPPDRRAPRSTGHTPGAWQTAMGTTLAASGRGAAAVRCWREAASLGDPDAAVRVALHYVERIRDVRARQVVRSLRTWQAALYDAADRTAVTDRLRELLSRWQEEEGRRGRAGEVFIQQAALLLPRTDAVAQPRLPDLGEFDDNARAALRAALDEPTGTAVTTGRVLSSLIQADPYGEWQRIWPFDPRSRRLLDAPEDVPAAGARLTGSLWHALVWVDDFTRTFRMRPIPAAALALALLRHPDSGAARVVMRLNGIDHDELLARVHQDLLRSAVPGVQER
ncbi:hypothetical protein [Micromonospora sp. NPDC051141]|uniref:hypothetical protein n=1 Tax=Micromonospora sp. NPDC051141 TaxID=3364284 RepID=UPI0037A67F74